MRNQNWLVRRDGGVKRMSSIVTPVEVPSSAAAILNLPEVTVRRMGRGVAMGRRRWFYFVATAAALAVIASAGASSLGSADSNPTTPLAVAQPPDPTPDPLQHAIAFRESFGLRADRGFVVQMEADASANRKYGIALTDAEVADLAVRQSRVDAILSAVARELEQDPSFAGLFIDQRLNGRLEVRTTGDPATIERLLAGYGQAGIVFHVARVQYTLQELEELQGAVVADSPNLLLAGIQVAAVGVDPRVNRVTVVVVDLDGPKRESLLRRYGPRVEPVDGELVELMSSTAAAR